MKLVMIHCRGQTGQDIEQLKQTLRAELRYGGDRGQVQLPADTVVELPYYGDLLARLVVYVAAPLGQELRAKGVVTIPNEATQGEILLEIATCVELPESDIRLEEGNISIQMGPLTGNWGKPLSGRSTKIRAFTVG